MSQNQETQSVSTNSKQISFRELTVEQGLSQNSVVSITQDSIGYMWFATQDGLNRYDGRKFTHYDFQFEDVTRPKYSKLGKLYVDRYGDLWIISNSGKLQKYVKEADSFKPIISIKKASVVYQTKNSDLLIGTFGQGLLQVNSKMKDTLQVLKRADQNIDIYDIISFQNKQVVASSKGILVLEGSNYKFENVPGFPKTNFSALATSNNQTVYLGSFGDGLFIKTNTDSHFKQFKGFVSTNFPDHLIIQDVLVDTNQKLWIATYGQGVYLVDFQNESIQHFLANKNDPYALHYNDVLSLYEDFNGVVWLGTDGAGLSYYDEYLFKFNVLTNNQLPNDVHVDVIRSIAINNDDFWLGTSGKGLTKVNVKNDSYITFTSDNSSISSNRIMSLLFYNNHLWLGHQTKGLQKLVEPNTFVDFPELTDYTLWNITLAAKNKLWLSTSTNGLLLFNTETGTIEKSFNTSNSNLKSNNIRIVENGDKDILWIGTEDVGIFKLHTKTHVIEDIKGILEPIKSLHFKNDTLWIGTNGKGLLAYNTLTKRIINYTTEQGLANNVIYGILPDNNNNLWLSTNKGITKFNMQTHDVDNYSNYDGLQAFEFNTGAYYKANDGTLYFGGLKGLNWFNPSQLSFNPTQPKTVITNFKVFNEDQDLKNDLELKHNKNTVTFTFSSLHFSQPERNQFKYRLVNNDAQWISAGNSNSAHYTNLPPNRYQFQVISSNYDGVWNPIPATYSFTILEPWYATNLAKITYLLLTIILVVWLYRYLKWRWQIKMQLQLEHEETNRLKKLDEFKTKLYTNISHEFRTPLTLISGPIDKQLAKPDLSENDKRELSLVKQNADRLLNLVDQMLNLSMLDSGQIKLKVSKANLSILLKQLKNVFQYQANTKNIQIQSTIQDFNQVWFDKDIIEKVVSNLLSNAIKYAPENSTVYFEAINKEGVLIISIINSTNQVGKKDLSKLFQRFYQDNKLSDGVGVGLALVRDLVSLSKGSIIANNIDDNKIQFTVSLPIRKENFNDAEIITDEYEEPIREHLGSSETKTNKELKLLVVEDESDIRSFIVSIFKDTYQVLEAKNGKIGLEKAQTYFPDLIISDIMMPELNGIDLCYQIKTNLLTSHIPVILLTAKVGEENEIEGLKIGADAYVTKPFNSDKLKIRVEKLIEIRQKIKTHFSQTFQINPELAISSTETEFLTNLQIVLDKHITNPEFNTEQLSKELHISRTQLHRKIKAITNMTTSEFIRSQRLKLAKDLLKKSDATISEIAYQVGFNTPSYFIKCFKETYGSTPSEYTSKS